jgi:hypothetical protein
LFVAVGTLLFASYLVLNQQSNIIKVAFLIIVGVFCFGFYKQRSMGIWSTLVANKENLYVIASVNGKEFLQLPWRYIASIKQGMHGLNKRGLIICIEPSLLEKSEIDLIINSLNVVKEDANQIIISVPTGIVIRNKAINGLLNCKSQHST